VFWVISVYFNIRNTLPKSGTFLLGHPVYIYIYMLNTDEVLGIVSNVDYLILCMCHNECKGVFVAQLLYFSLLVTCF